jgi:chemotaxis protein CheD
MTAFWPPAPSPEELNQIFIVPGSLYCTSEPCVVSTVLGSCVSLCLWDSVNRVGGMNHYVLPYAPAGASGLRYGDVAIEALWHAMERLGTTRRQVRAKVFGGAAVLPVGHDETVGERNVRLALAWLSDHGIPVISSHTGGQTGLQIRFNTGDGTVTVRSIAPQHAARPR